MSPSGIPRQPSYEAQRLPWPRHAARLAAALIGASRLAAMLVATARLAAARVGAARNTALRVAILTAAGAAIAPGLAPAARCAPTAAPAAAPAADGARHFLWALHGKHNTVYLLGSIHTLRAGDYPLAPAIMAAYRDSKSLVMEINLDEVDSADLQAQMMRSATLPPGTSLAQILGSQRYARAKSLAGASGFDLSLFDQFAPWFVAEAVSQLELTQLGFEPQSGVEMYFKGRSQVDGKNIAGLETAREQIALFENMPLEQQVQYLMSSLEETHDLPKEADDMVRAWARGDTAWFQAEIQSDFGRDPVLYRSFVVARNRKWISKIESLLDANDNTLVIVGSAHLVGVDGVIELLRKDGVGVEQR